MTSRSSATTPWLLSLLVSLLVALFQYPVIVRSEIIQLDVLIDASNDEVHFVRGYLQAPASIDLSAVTFLTTREPEFLYGDDDFTNDNNMNDDSTDDTANEDGGGEDDDQENDEEEDGERPQPETDAPTSQPVATDAPTVSPVPETDPPVADTNTEAEGTEPQDSTPAPPTEDVPADGSNADASGEPEGEGTDTNDNETPPGDNGDGGGGGGDDNGGNRRMQRLVVEQQSKFHHPRVLDDGSAKQIMDIVLFMVPEDCKKDSWGTCDWAKLGVGTYDEMMEGGQSYCCSADTAGRGLCNSDDIGTIIIDHAVFRGEHRKVPVPQSTDQSFVIEDPKFDIESSGDYVLVISNCNDYGLDVLALGNMEWKSVMGYLPGDMFDLMLFYGALTAFYFFLALWYYCGMRIYQDTAIPIQKYILATMVVGFLEVLFRTADFASWNSNGLRSDVVMYTAMSLGVLKRGVSRCLGVMVAMGWGVVRESLGSALSRIIVLGLLYSGLTLARDFFIVAAEEVQTITMSTKYYELMDFAWILTMLVIFINLIFYFWIISSLNSTTEYLRNMNQTSKLKRHLRLRCLILISFMIVAIWLIVYIVQAMTLMLTQNLVWILEAVMHVNYLFILVGVSILWRPNSHAKDYAMQMELPSSGDDENELELSCVVPSAGDDMGDYDGNDPDHRNGIQVDNAVLG
ncbi:seven transmembrane receptor [Nitzschia inconspicua]|uniref:Seven transmembrane receptor n=1 Tax=Nitzschia inconspicua TaxID=303405 RepID=A0A9K3LGT5_9STRA|nr:seven transmembrane receptor [Nitzschia inconspicua]